jgi:hypothetical protein
VRLVCSGWRAVHDAWLQTLVPSARTDDATLATLLHRAGRLGLRFPTLRTLDLRHCDAMTDRGLGHPLPMMLHRFPTLTSLDLSNGYR